MGRFVAFFYVFDCEVREAVTSPVWWEASA